VAVWFIFAIFYVSSWTDRNQYLLSCVICHALCYLNCVCHIYLLERLLHCWLTS